MTLDRSSKARLSFVAGGVLAFALTVVVVRAQPPAQQGGGGTGPAAFPGINWTEDQLKQAVAPLRAGRKLTPRNWPNGAKVAVCVSFDIDNESPALARGNPNPDLSAMSDTEFGSNFGRTGALPSPELIFNVYKDEFDMAYEEGTMVMLTMHPHVSGRRSRAVHLARLLDYMKSKPNVWFATAQQIVEYVKKNTTPSQ